MKFEKKIPILYSTEVAKSMLVECQDGHILRIGHNTTCE